MDIRRAFCFGLVSFVFGAMFLKALEFDPDTNLAQRHQNADPGASLRSSKFAPP